MGICTDGGMIVGAKVVDATLNIPQDYEWGEWEWCEDQGLEIMSPWYDASFEECTVGYSVKDVAVFDLEDGKWFREIDEKAQKFHKLFGANPMLIGMQNVY